MGPCDVLIDILYVCLYAVYPFMVYTEKEQSNLCAPPPPTRCKFPSTRGVGLHRVRNEWSDLAAAGAAAGVVLGLPGGSVVKNPPAKVGDTRDDSLILGLGRASREGKWQPTPILLPGKSHVQRSLVGYRPWGHKELDMTERLSVCTHTQTHPGVITLNEYAWAGGLMMKAWRRRPQLPENNAKCLWIEMSNSFSGFFPDQLEMSKWVQPSWPFEKRPKWFWAGGGGQAENNRARTQKENNYGNEMFCVSWNLEAGRDLLFWETTETSRSKMVLETLWNVQEKAFCEDCNLHFLEQRHCLSSGAIHRQYSQQLVRKWLLSHLRPESCEYAATCTLDPGSEPCSYTGSCVCDGWSVDASPWDTREPCHVNWVTLSPSDFMLRK